MEAINYESIVQEMLDAGYKEFSPNPLFGGHASKAYQKKYLNNTGIKYFITCYEYNWTDIDHYRPYHKSWSFHGQFELTDGRTFNFETVSWFFYKTEWGHKVSTLKDVEDFFEKMWVTLECVPYE